MNATEQETARPPMTSDILRSPQNHKLILCLSLALATLALYNPVAHAPFLNFDDPIYVTDNVQVRAGLTWKTVAWTFRTPESLDWHPLTWLSHALDCQLFGLNPAGPHIVNVLLHAASAVLLFLILAKATGFAWRSLAVASLFALHPLNVESVAWIAERKSVLSMFFFVLALAAYGWYARRPGTGRYLVVTLAYALGLMSKVQIVTFPCALLLLDYWPLRRCREDCVSTGETGADPDASAQAPAWWRLILEKVPWFAMSAVSAVIAMRTGGQGFSDVLETAAAQAQLPLWLRLANGAISYVRYLEKIFWPANLAIMYPHPAYRISLRAAVLSALVLAAVSVLAVIFRQRRAFFVGWFWFVGTLVPMSGVVPIGPHAMADRYTYIPALGIFVILCWGVADLLQHWHVSPALVAGGAVVILLVLGTALHRQVSLWTDNVTLWTHTLEVTEGNFTAEENLGTALIDQGKPAEALAHLRRASALRPDDPMTALNLATYDQMLGNYQAALDGYARVIEYGKAAPRVMALAQANRGYAHLALKQYEKAKQDFEAALEQQPENAMAYRGLGLLAQKAGDLVQATKDYERSIELQPTPVGYLLLAHALDLGGQEESARAALSRAAGMDRDLSVDIATVNQLLAE